MAWFLLRLWYSAACGSNQMPLLFAFQAEGADQGKSCQPGVTMLHDMWLFLIGGWIGSLITQVLIALMRKNSEVPSPLDEKTAQLDGAVKVRKTYDAA